MNIKTFFMNRWVKICGAVLLTVILLLLLLPVGAKYYLAYWLEKNGADRATIKTLSFNPFVGRFAMGGVEIFSGGHSLFHNASMVVKIGLASLRNHNIHIETLKYQDLSIDLQQYPDGRWRFGTYTMGPPSAGAEQQPATDRGDGAVWALLADRVVLAGCHVHLKTPELDSKIEVEQAELVRFTTREGQPSASLTLHGQIDASRVDLQLENLQIVPDLKMNGTITISDGKLALAAGFVKDALPTFGGVVGLSGKVAFSQTAETGMVIEYNGTIDTAGVDIGNSSFANKAKSLQWQGLVTYSDAPKKPIIVKTDGTLTGGNYSLLLPNGAFATDESLVALSGVTTVTIGKDVNVENTGSLRIEGIGVQLPQMALKEEKLGWKGKVVYNSAGQAQGAIVRTDGSLDLGAFQLSGGEPTAKFDVLGTTTAWQGKVLYGLDAGSSRVDLDGTLSGNTLKADLAESKSSFEQEKFSLQAKSTIHFGEQLVINGALAATTEKFAFRKDDKPFVGVESLVVTGLEGGGQGLGKIAVQSLNSTGISADIAGALPLAVKLQEIHVADAAFLDLERFTAAQVQLKGASAKAVRTNRELARLKQLSLKNLQGKGAAQASVGNIALEGLTVLDAPAGAPAKEKPALSLGRATLSEAGWDETLGLQGDTLQCDDLLAAILREKDGGLKLSKVLAAMQEPHGEKGPGRVQNSKASGAEKELPFRLNKLVVGGKSKVLFTDQTLAVPFVTDLAISNLQAGAFDSAKPEEKTQVQLTGLFENRAPIEVSGEMSPFLPQPALDLKLNLKNYPLSSLSAYTVQSVGTALASGQLRLKSHAKLAKDVLSMDNSIELQKLTTETISPELAAQLNNQLPIPLDAALSLLRDSEDNITLDIPLNGPVRDLSVGISDVLITGLSKAIIPAASGYLMYALGPYGALAYVGMKVGEKLMQVQLPPLVFKPSTVEITDEHGKYLERIATILKDRPKTDMQVCPVVASWEMMSEKARAAAGDVIEIPEKSRDALLDLGQRRAEAVRSYLVQKYAISQDRLLICDTKIVKEKDAQPAVILQL